MCKAVNREFKHYNENSGTKASIAALSAEVGIPTSELIQSLRGCVPELQGTWVRPRVAMHLAQWASPEFAVVVSGWVWDIVSGEKATLRPRFDDAAFVSALASPANTADRLSARLEAMESRLDAADAARAEERESRRHAPHAGVKPAPGASFLVDL
jgi:hypothetical protein